MKKALIFTALVILILPIISAEIIINQQPSGTYNLGDKLSIPVKITTTSDINGFFTMGLICAGQEKEFHREYIVLEAGEEKDISSSILLVTSLIGTSKGGCKIKAALLEEYVLTDDFSISNLITVEVKTETTEFVPEQELFIEGEALKLNGAPVEGLVEMRIDNQENHLVFTVSGGYFAINHTFAKDVAAGGHTLNIKVYERDQENNVTNQGFIDHAITITQVPTNLELAFESDEVLPGTPVKTKAILHDQTGESIPATAIITIKNSKGKIKEQVERATDEVFEYNIPYNEPPSDWIVYAVSSKLDAEVNFTILENQEIDFQLVNRTLILTNVGNVQYNKTILVKISDESVNIKTDIPVGKSQKYTLTAPDGEYEIEVITDGENRLTESALLTGKVIDIKEITGVTELVRRPFIWIFVVLICGFVAFMVLKKGTKRTFLGGIRKSRKSPEKSLGLLKTKSLPQDAEINLHHLDKTLVDPKSRAELSLSLKGEKQDASVICMKIKNMPEVHKNKQAALEALRLVIATAEKEKAVIYENAGFIFFIIAPAITKTFKNELPAIKLARKIKEALSSHNKMFQQKINFGISVNRGTIVAKKEDRKYFLRLLIQ